MTSAPWPQATQGLARPAALAMILICAAQFVLQLDFSIVNVALPTIQRDLAMPAAQLQWIVTGYALTFGSLLLAGGQLWLAQISVSSSYAAAVLPGLLLTSVGIGLALPTASIAITAGVRGRDQGLAGALFTTGQQTGAAVGLAVLATVAAARTAHAAGSLTAGYRLSFLVATGIALLAAVLAAWRLGSRDCQQELARQQPEPGAPPVTPAEAQLRKC